jgi:hypothetical protein
MLKLEGNKILYHDDIEYAEIEGNQEEIILHVTKNPLLSSELSDLIEILKVIEARMDGEKAPY